MNTKDIRGALERDPYSLRLFRAVGPRESFVEALEKRDKAQGLYVFNTHYSHEPGEHWVCGRIADARVDLFDSYGRHPRHYAPDVWVSAVKRVGKRRVYWNGRRVQGLTSNVCGDYCTLYALLLSRGWKSKRIISRLLTDVKNNESRDHVVRRFIIRRYGLKSLSNIEDGEGVDGVHVQGTLTLIDALKASLN